VLFSRRAGDKKSVDGVVVGGFSSQASLFAQKHFPGKRLDLVSVFTVPIRIDDECVQQRVWFRRGVTD
jgi:hypothetical protein